jgi:nicotinamidase-related amidase
MPISIELPDLMLHDGAALTSLIDPASTALLVVDIQVDFVAPHGFFGRLGADLRSIEPAIDAIERLITVARRAGLPIVFIRAADPSVSSAAMQRFLTRKAMVNGAELCRAGHPGADYYRVRPVDGDIEIEKRTYDGFFETPLTDILQKRGIETVIVSGVATDCCVDLTARSAFLRGMDVVIATDACAAGTTYLHYGALTALAQNAALLADTNAIVEALSTKTN